MKATEIMYARKSVRTYTGQPILESQLEAVLKSANAAPVGLGQYDGVHLTVITKSELLEKINEACAAFMGRPGVKPLYGAPTLIIVSAKINPMAESVAHANAAIIVQNMALTATELGVGACHIWGAIVAINKNAELLAELKLPEGFIPSAGIVLGQTEEVYSERDIPNRIKIACIK